MASKEPDGRLIAARITAEKDGVSGEASAQTYISVSPPPAAFAPPLVIDASPPKTITTAASSRNSDQREVTIQNVVDRKGNPSYQKDLLARSP